MDEHANNTRSTPISSGTTQPRIGYDTGAGLTFEALREDRLLEMAERRASFCSAIRLAMSCLYSASSAWALATAVVFAALRARLRWTMIGVTRRWIFGDLLTSCETMKH